MADLCCPLVEVDIRKHQHQKSQMTQSPEMCSLDDLHLGTWGQTETGKDSDEGSSRELPGEAQHLTVLAVAERTLGVTLAFV